MPAAPTRKIAPDAPIVLDAGQGWTWVWLKTRTAIAAEHLNIGKYKSEPTDSSNPVFSLRDAKGLPQATLEFRVNARYDWILTSPNWEKIIGERREPDAETERRYWQAVPILALRLLVNGDPGVPVPDGLSRFETHANTGTVKSRAGVPHCEDGPAIELDGIGLGRAWFKDGILHRIGGPAVEGFNWATEYYVDGRRHRDDGPAYESMNERRWLVNGKLHRKNAPAIEMDHGDDLHYVDGVQQASPIGDWKDMAALLLIAAHGVPVGVKHNRDDIFRLIGRFGELRKIAEDLDRSGVGIRWNAATKAAINAAYTAKTKDAAARPAFESLKAKCVRLALMLTTDPALVPDSERASLLGLLNISCENHPPHLGSVTSPSQAHTLGLATRLRAALIAAAPESAEPPAGDGPVEFAFAWSRQTRSGRPVPQRHVGRSEATLDRVSAEDAPVFATLRRPDGGDLDIRRIDGVPYRPILSPDGWEPIGEGAFRAAARDGVAWRDGPFRDRPQADCCVMALDEFCSPSQTKDDETERTSALEATTKAGHLVVVDGVVYRRTEEPELFVAATQKSTGLGGGHVFGNPQPHDRRIEVGWRLGCEIASTDIQATIVSSSQRHPLFRVGIFEQPEPVDDRRLANARATCVAGLAFQPDASDMASLAANGFARLVGLPFVSNFPIITLADIANEEIFDPTQQLRAIAFDPGGDISGGKDAAERALAAFESRDKDAIETAIGLLDAYAISNKPQASADYTTRLIGTGPLTAFDARLAVLAEVASKALRALTEASNDEDEDIAAFSTFHP